MSLELILIIEDDVDISELIEYNLEQNKFRTSSTSYGEWGISEAIKLKPNLILLDLMLPNLGGLEVCRRIKANPIIQNIPIIMLTAKSQEHDIISGFNAGADDYLTKPFSPKELIARIKAVLRRTKKPGTTPENSIRSGNLLVDNVRHEIYYKDKLLNFTLTEFKLISAMISQPGKVFTREQLLEKINNLEYSIIDRNIDVHIRSIRKKTNSSDNLIHTVRGVGYKYQESHH